MSEKMKYSITSLIDKEKNIDYQYGGRRSLMDKNIEKDVKDMHKNLFDKHQELKRLTTKIA